jgi:hypothetical protein
VCVYYWGILGDMCYMSHTLGSSSLERRRAECVFITAGPSTKLFSWTTGRNYCGVCVCLLLQDPMVLGESDMSV